MQIGMIGLGRMGGNMTRRLLERGHAVAGYDPNESALRTAAGAGAAAAASPAELVARLEAPRAVWVMVPAGAPTEQTVTDLASLLAPDDIVIDGGNSRYTDTVRRAGTLAEAGIHLLDVGTSGGVWGLTEGYCLMVGGPRSAYERVEPVLTALATEGGYAHVGDSGAGHFVKMIHNGIEYALMQAYAEGFELMRAGTPSIDTAQVAELWRHGSVIRSWLLDLAAGALKSDPDLSNVSSRVEDSGEGRWTVETAIEKAVPLPAITLALFARFASRQDDSFGARLLSALRREFGGHGSPPGVQ